MGELKFWIFDESAVTGIINTSQLQSIEFTLGQDFVQCLRSGNNGFSTHDIHAFQNSDGLVFCGKYLSPKILIFDLTQCQILSASDADLLFIIQKAFRSAIRVWNSFPLTSSEKLLKNNNIVLFPFPFSKNFKETYRLVFQVNAENGIFSKRNIESAVIAYKYGIDGATKGPSAPDDKILKSAVQFYRSQQNAIRESFSEKSDIINKRDTSALHQVITVDALGNKGFKYMPYENQMQNLTTAQQTVVNHEDMSAPIRVEGPAGTGKTLSLILRAVRILREAETDGRNIRLAFFTHNNSTELSVRTQFETVANLDWCNPDNPQSIIFSTLQHFCADYIQVGDNKIIDSDAYEAKQNQLMLIGDIYDHVFAKSFKTYQIHLSPQMASFLTTENKEHIIVLLQHEFSVQIKGRALGNYDEYLRLPALKNGLPMFNSEDKGFIFKIYAQYQSALEQLQVYDTDDVVLQATSLFNAPFWRRERSAKGFDYIFIDEMHMFNVNEQQAFYYLNKDITQKTIPMCFALDYAQAVGDQGDIRKNYSEQTFSSTASLKQEFKTVFRNSPQIAELCAAIMSSGPDLFMLQDFINPYKDMQTNFTAREESLCTIPELLMYENDNDMLLSLKDHVEMIQNSCHCRLGEIAIIPFDEELLDKETCEKTINKKVVFFSGKNSFAYDAEDREKKRVMMLSPENVNGLEFHGVILLGVDEGRVPQSSSMKVSANYLRYSALNKLYLACSRAKYKVLILGTTPRGDSPCLAYALENGFLERKEIDHS